MARKEEEERIKKQEEEEQRRLIEQRKRVSSVLFNLHFTNWLMSKRVPCQKLKCGLF